MKPRPEVPDDLTRPEQESLWGWTRTHYPWLTQAMVRGYVNECLSHHAASGNRRGYHVWERACRNWIVRGERWANERMVARTGEMPQEQGERDNAPSAVVFDLFQSKRRRSDAS